MDDLLRNGGTQEGAGRVTAGRPALVQLSPEDRRELLVLLPLLYGPLVTPHCAVELYGSWIAEGLADLDRFRFHPAPAPTRGSS